MLLLKLRLTGEYPAIALHLIHEKYVMKED